MRTIVTARLRLVPVTPENSDVLWSVLQQPDLREFQDLPEVDRPQFRRMVAARPRNLVPGSWGRFEWLLQLTDTDEPAGWASLRIAERSTTTGEIGYSVVREYRGRGFASEALRAIVDEAFSNLDMRKVRAYCVPDNAPSRRVLANAGFEEDGVLPHGATVRGKPVDVLGFVLERVRWIQREAV
ncbi:MAG: GNAT family N-acetyltransferase [Candidatus Eremiobacteraeota bacterium]|nr:GNAT family N-acetyltransferase [Candidatus Eremiobacteraeota bacterium]